MGNAPLADQADRDRIRYELATTLVVEAAAGTGKTTALVGRMLEALASGRARLERMVAVTFTDAAAGELKLRLRSAIERERQSPVRSAEERLRLEDALPQLEVARIGTIHAFCAELLRERPVEAGVDPQFQVAPEDIARRHFARVFERWFERQLADPGPGVRRALRQPGRGRAPADGPRGRLRRAAWGLVQWRDFPTQWRREPFDRDAAIDDLMVALAAVGEAPPVTDRSDSSDRSVREIERFVADVARREQLTGRDYDGLEAELCALARARHWRWTGFRSDRDRERTARRERRAAARDLLERFVRRAGADLAPLLRDDLWPLAEDYERLKSRAGCLDFVDLLLRARDLVRDASVVRRGLQTRWTHIFVDEFQDTDPLQAELLLLLASDDPDERNWRRVRPVPGKLFLVGDPKQSIYRFRRADVGLYEGVKRQLVAAGAAVVHLTVSFRSVPAIQEAVNAAFAPAMAAGTSGTQAAYVPLAPFRAPLSGQPAVVALPVPQPFGKFGIVDFAIDDSLPDAVAAFVAWLVTASGWRVTEVGRPDAAVPVESRHVCLLFRRMRSWNADVTRAYVRALEARNLRHVLVGGSSFHAREEIEALRNVLLAVERPEDELSVFATLRGPFFALDDGALLAWRDRYRSLHPFRALPEEPPAALRPVVEALAVLRDLHRQRNKRPFADTIARFLAAVRAHAGLAIWPTGEQALANVGRLLDLARRAERQGVTSFRAFVEHLEADADRAEEGEAPIVEDGTDGVRIMTVHRAKGLEFPVVILADITANLAREEVDRRVDPDRRVCALRLCGSAPPELLEHEAEERARDQEEGVRTLYVAATRARDVLVVPAVGDARIDSWVSPLAPAVYPLPGTAHAPLSSQPPGCPSLVGDCVADVPADVRRSANPVRPGLHRPELGTHEVVWWAPRALVLRVDEDVGLKQKKLLAADERGERSQAGIDAHAAWQHERERVRGGGGTPSLRVATATEQAAVSDDEASAVAVERAAATGQRPHGRRFGTLVHEVLAAVDLDADRATVTEAAALRGRLLGASAEEVEAAADVVVHALLHPVLRRAAAAPDCRRETAVLIRLGDGTVVEGVVDAAFADADGWTVVDFKTDVELGTRLGDYRRQVALYARAIARATGRPARGVLLRV